MSNNRRPNLANCGCFDFTIKLAGLGLCLQELQNFVCLIARGFSLSLRPSGKRLRRYSYGLGYFGNVLNDDVPIVSKSSKLFFCRFHGLTSKDFLHYLY